MEHFWGRYWFSFCKEWIVISNIFSTDRARLRAANTLLPPTASLVDMCINPCDYILSGFLNEHVCSNCLQTFVNLQNDVRKVTKYIGINVLGPTAKNSFCLYEALLKSQDSAVGIATGYGADDGGPGRVKDLLFSTSSRQDLRPTQPPIQWVPGALYPG
jgi:hypothetical protein